MGYHWVRSSETSFEAKPSFGFPMTVIHNDLELYREMSPAILERVFDSLYCICELTIGTSQCIGIDGDRYDVGIGKTEYAFSNVDPLKTTIMIGLHGIYELVEIEFALDTWILRNANHLLILVMGLQLDEIKWYIQEYVWPHSLNVEATFFADKFQALRLSGDERELTERDEGFFNLVNADLKMIFKLKYEERIHRLSMDHDTPSLTYDNVGRGDGDIMHIVLPDDFEGKIVFSTDQGVTTMKLTMPLLMAFYKWSRSIAQLYHRYIDTQYFESRGVDVIKF